MAAAACTLCLIAHCGVITVSVVVPDTGTDVIFKICLGLPVRRWDVTDPVMVAVASALAAKAAEGLSDGGRAAFSALARFVRHRLRGDPDSERALEAARAQPHDDECVRRLAAVLETAVARDRWFAEELNELWIQLRHRPVAGVDAGNGMVNRAIGPVSGTLVQARDVQGGIRLGPPGPGS
ncbi:hypothetical protein ACN27G_15315 [Plantactinospora sp. WMMB334]|uniref:hypothetical protein n=1 Tax=Plantactinospora sp. WMMB334 TaxID=3404119 RepID=UPI003B957D06